MANFQLLRKKGYNWTMKNFKTYNAEKKELLSAFMKSFFSDQKKLNAEKQLHVALDRLEHFATQGKMLRGIFVILSCEMYGGVLSHDVLRVASAMELTHATLLVHDDIMDNDQMRRNEQTMFARYALDAQELQLPDPTTYGKSVAMIVGDTSLLLAFELLSSVDAPSEVKREILVSFSQEMIRVASGQLLDFDFGQISTPRTENEIESMYRLKTGGYTFSLPFVCGALLAQANSEERKKLYTLTQILGNTFQLKDDELGIMGDSEVTGKSPGSDVREGKKTLLWMRLLAACTPQEKKLLDSYLGTSLTQQQIHEIRSILHNYGITEAIQKEIDSSMVRAYEIIDSLNVEDTYKVLLKELADYNAHRTA